MLTEKDDSGNIVQVTEKLFNDFWEHPLVKGLYKQTVGDKAASLLPGVDRPGRPSYIPAKTFVLALLDLGKPDSGTQTYDKIEDIKAVVEKLPSHVKKALLPHIDAAGQDAKKARKNMEDWFDAAMERVSGWYARKAAIITVIFALFMTISLNADTILMVQQFSQNDTLRAATVEAADEAVANSEQTLADLNADEALAELEKLQLPVGWGSEMWPEGGEEWFLRVLGWLITALAISLGAPFWFDVLNKVANVRKSVKPSAEEPKTEEEQAPVRIRLETGPP